jgi:hypothetical protein
VVFSVDSSSGTGVCNVSGTNGTKVRYTATGNCVIDANQAGNSKYNAATQVTRTITVGKDTTITFVSPSPTSVAYGNESAAAFWVAVTTHNGEAVPNGESVAVHIGSATCTVILKGGKGVCRITNAALPVGSYFVSATYGGDANLSGSRGWSASKLHVHRKVRSVSFSVARVIGLHEDSASTSAGQAL